MDKDELLQWDALIHRVARRVCRSYPDVEFEDTKAEMWLKFLEADARREGGFLIAEDSKLVESRLFFKAKTYAIYQRKLALTISPQYGYRTVDVHALFATFFDYICWEAAELPEDAYSEEGSDALAMSSDLSRAWDKLPANYRNIIFREHALHDELTKSERVLLARAVDRVTEILNTYEPG